MSTSTVYYLSLNAVNGGGVTGKFFAGSGPDGDGWDDSVAVAVATALKSVSAIAGSFSIGKTTTDITQVSLNLATDPPSWP